MDEQKKNLQNSTKPRKIYGGHLKRIIKFWKLEMKNLFIMLSCKQHIFKKIG